MRGERKEERRKESGREERKEGKTEREGEERWKEGRERKKRKEKQSKEHVALGAPAKLRPASGSVNARPRFP